ncbi:MAG: hypothetical protein WBV93_09195, partial [Anaerobacillus sp.]
IILIVIVLVIGYLVAKNISGKNNVINSGNHTKLASTTQNKSANPQNGDWLENRWKLASQQKLSGNDGVFPNWYFDEVTERQIEKLKELGVSVNKKKITKGQASDLIGMHEPAEEESIEILKFFKIPTRGIKQTQARHEVSMLFQEEMSIQAWKERPPTTLQNEFCKFFGLKLEKGTTHEQAAKIINDHESELSENDDPRLEEWEAFEQIIEELSDPDFRQDYEIKKPSATLIKKAIGELQKEGNSYQEISDDIDLLVDKLIELKPDLERE